jgi:putative ABC transport system permease protein
MHQTMHQSLQHIRRLFQRTPLFAITIIVMLAVGIGAATAIFALVNAVLIRSLPYPDAERLVTVHHTAKVSIPYDGVSPGPFLYYQKQNHVFEAMGFYQFDRSMLRDNDSPEQVGAVTAPGSGGHASGARAAASDRLDVDGQKFLQSA